MSSENTQEINAQCPKCFTMCNEKDVDYDSKHCKICKPKTATDRLAEELEKFENGAQRYDSQASFAAALNSLSHGLGVYAVLDNTLRRVALLNQANQELAKKLKGVRSFYGGLLGDLQETRRALQAEKAILIEKLKKHEHI
jgi:hypothetical protein